MSTDTTDIHRPLATPTVRAAGRTLRFGYVPLTDAAPLLIAREKGGFHQHGLAVELSRSMSWAGLRDRIAFGLLDGAQMLSPMPIAASLGLGGVQTDLVVAATLGRNGNTITLGETLWARPCSPRSPPPIRGAPRATPCRPARCARR